LAGAVVVVAGSVVVVAASVVVVASSSSSSVVVVGFDVEGVVTSTMVSAALLSLLHAARPASRATAPTAAVKRCPAREREWGEVRAIMVIPKSKQRGDARLRAHAFTSIVPNPTARIGSPSTIPV